MTPKDKALHTLSRVVVNFQRLEHNLKLLSNLGPIYGHIESIESQLERRLEKSSRFTLGAAINSWIDVLNGKTMPEGRTEDLFSITINHNITFNLDPSVQEAHANGLKALLEERNAIIHGGLADFPWNSESDCEGLIVYLDSLNSAIGEHMQFLKSISESLQRVFKSNTIVIEPGKNEWEYRASLLQTYDV